MKWVTFSTLSDSGVLGIGPQYLLVCRTRKTKCNDSFHVYCDTWWWRMVSRWL